MAYFEGIETKPNNPGQLYLRDVQKLKPNTELFAYMSKDNRGTLQETYSGNPNISVDISDEDISNKKLPLQFIHTKIIKDEVDRYFWHAFVRNMSGQEFYIDLGNYGAVCWEGTYNPHRWLTLKE